MIKWLNKLHEDFGADVYTVIRHHGRYCFYTSTDVPWWLPKFEDLVGICLLPAATFILLTPCRKRCLGPTASFRHQRSSRVQYRPQGSPAC